MTQRYVWVQWNRHKQVYDLVLAGVCIAYLCVFVGVSLALHRPPEQISLPILLIRAFGTLAIILLHVILAIGPLARCTKTAAPLLYNRRHLGVTFFLAALVHAALTIGFYGGFGTRNPAAALAAPESATFAAVSGFPFEMLGLLALLVFFVMAATSHDFWLKNLSARTWKSIHMLIYPAYGLVLLHVALGAVRSEPSPLYPAMLLLGAAIIATLHVVAGLREWSRDVRYTVAEGDWLDVASVDDLAPNAAAVVCLRGRERIALVRSGDSLSAVSNICAHQGGPLGEGRVVDGCLTCPWHGYQYIASSGQSPPPFTERIPTYDIRLEGKRVLVRSTPNAPGTPVEPVSIPTDVTEEGV